MDYVCGCFRGSSKTECSPREARRGHLHLPRTECPTLSISHESFTCRVFTAGLSPLVTLKVGKWPDLCKLILNENHIQTSGGNQLKDSQGSWQEGKRSRDLEGTEIRTFCRKRWYSFTKLIWPWSKLLLLGAEISW